MTSISEEYASKIIEEIILRALQSGVAPTIQDIETAFNNFTLVNDINTPIFKDSNYSVARSSESSASKFNEANNQIKEDMEIALRTLFRTTRESVELFNKWETKASKLENKVLNLEARMDRLLSGIQDTAGYFNTVGDKFTDTDKIDLGLTKDVSINLEHNIITLAKSSGTSSSVTRLFPDLDSSQVRFNILTSSSVVRVSNEINTEPVLAFSDQTGYWKTNISAQSRISPMLTELNVSFLEPVRISKLSLLLHSSQSNSTTKITPMYSSDGTNYSRLPISNTIAEVLEKAEFQFPELQVSKLKFLLEKSGHDFVDSSGFYVYEFGAKEIALFRESYSSDPNFKGKLVSKPLNIRKPDGSNVLFNKTTLEVCEVTTDQTPLNYFVAVAKEENSEPTWLTPDGFTPNYIAAGVDTRIWSPISPLNRTEHTHPTLLDFTVSAKQTKKDIGLSYSRDGGDYVSPKRSFNLMVSAPGGTIDYVSASNKLGTENRRYFPIKSSHYLLDLQIDSSLDLDLENILLWRNVGERGIAPGDTTKRVRGIQRGWEYKQPYYTTVILIENSDGISIDVGSNPITIDNNNYTGLVGPGVLSQGRHTIRVHRDYWREVPPGLESLSSLQSRDPLYPFNQKLLIEGYSYGSSFEGSRIYQGADRFAGSVMTKVSLFDILHNVPSTDYTKFALDLDAPLTSLLDHDSSDSPLSRVFIVHSNTEIADFMNEKFMLEFNLTSELYSYIALKAELSTTNSQLTPVLDEYRIKLGA